jgi:hypothetical protein
VKVGDYYNFGYDNAKRTHYSLSFEGLTKSKERSGYAQLYIDRQKGKPLVDLLTQRDKNWPSFPWTIRAKVLLDPQFVHGYDDAEEMYTLIDWQLLGSDGWTPWYSEVIAPTR